MELEEYFFRVCGLDGVTSFVLVLQPYHAASNFIEQIQNEADTGVPRRPTTTATDQPPPPPDPPPQRLNGVHNPDESAFFTQQLTDRQRQQIYAYRNGTGLLLNIHAVHHGGTSFCGTMGKPGRGTEDTTTVPNKACWKDRDGRMTNVHTTATDDTYHTQYLDTAPWLSNVTEQNILDIRPYYHMISWEYNGVQKMTRSLAATALDTHDQLVSVIITRHPLSRLLAKDDNMPKKYYGYNKGYLSHAGWWQYAAEDHFYATDNFFLRILGYYPYPKAFVIFNKQQHNKHKDHHDQDDEKTTSDIHNRTTARRLTRNKIQKKQKQKNKKALKLAMQQETKDEGPYIARNVTEMLALYPSNINRQAQYEQAVKILQQATLVLDIACLDDGMLAVGDLLHLPREPIQTKIRAAAQERAIKAQHNDKSLSPRERIGYDDVYDYLVQKNYWDIKLYEYSQTISVVRC